MDELIWEGANKDGDRVHVWQSDSGDFPVSFDNQELGCAGATVIPKEAFRAIRRKALEESAQIVKRFLIFPSQRAVSWHEVQDAIDAIRNILAEGGGE